MKRVRKASEPSRTREERRREGIVLRRALRAACVAEVGSRGVLGRHVGPMCALRGWESPLSRVREAR